MAITITDLPGSRALDVTSAIRGAAGAGDWCLSAFSPYQSAPLSPIAIYGTNYLNPSQNPLNLIQPSPALPHS